MTSYGFYNLFIKLSSDKLSPPIAVIFLTGASFVVALVAALIIKISGQPLSFSKNVILFPIVAGPFAGIAELFYMFMFSKGAPLSIGNPIVVGGTVIIATILGIILLREPLQAMKIVGIIVTIAGLVILTRV